MKKVYFDGETVLGSFIYGACVTLNEDYTMLQLVTAIKEAGFASFKTETMKILVKI